MASQKVAVFDRIGDGTDFTIAGAPIPEPGPNEVRFKVAAFALNQADMLPTKGRHGVEVPLPIRTGYRRCLPPWVGPADRQDHREGPA